MLSADGDFCPERLSSAARWRSRPSTHGVRGRRRFGASGQVAETITGAQLGDFTSFDPFFVLAFDRLQHFQIYDPLIRLAPDTGGYAPWLATAWELAKDGRTLTLTLRENVKFHSGAAMTATDVVANLERARDKTIGHTLSGAASVIKSVSAVDAKTVRVEYDEPLRRGSHWT